MKLPKLLTGLVFSLFFLSACSAQGPIVILPGGQEVKIEVAQTNEEKQVGLMNRTEMDEDSGMLFVYKEEQDMSFWMKNTLIPLDIIYISRNQIIVDIQTMQPCKMDPCRSYPSSAPAQFALEVNAGMADVWGLEVGEHLKIEF